MPPCLFLANLKVSGLKPKGLRLTSAQSAVGAFISHPLFWCGVAALLFAGFGEVPRPLRWPVRIVIFAIGTWGLGCFIFTYRHTFGRMLAPFRNGVRLDPVLLALFVVMHAILLANAILHYSLENYDQEPHRQNARIWAELRMPLMHETRGIHYAPLAYWPTSLALRLGYDEKVGLKAAQISNVFYSSILVFFLLKLGDLCHPHGIWFKRAMLLVLATLPVYYKTFAMPRPEPMLAMWAVVAMYLAVRIFCFGYYTRPVFLAFGLTVGLMLLTRQWGAFLFPAFGVLFLFGLGSRTSDARRLLFGLIMASAITILVGGWYYALLTAKYGSPTAFNSELMPFSLSNKPLGFYFDWFPKAYFDHPVIYTMGDRMIPILLADTWGDYWGYWHVARPPFRTQESEVHDVVKVAVPFLSRVSKVSLVCTASLAVGWVTALGAGLRNFQKNGVSLALAIGILSTCACYFVFVVCYKNSSAIKSSYILQVFPFLAFTYGFMIDQMALRKPRVSLALLTLYFAAALHQAPLFFTGKIKFSEVELLEPLANPLLLATLASGALYAAWLFCKRKEKGCSPAQAVRSSSSRWF